MDCKKAIPQCALHGELLTGLVVALGYWAVIEALKRRS